MNGQREKATDLQEKVGAKKQPDGEKILETLLRLYAKQEGVQIKYKIWKGVSINETNAN